MKSIVIITIWEFIRHFRSRGFLLATFVSPLLFAAVILIPLLFLEQPNPEQLRIIGCLEVDTTGICPEIQSRFREFREDDNSALNLQLVTISPDTSLPLRNRYKEVERLKIQLDSLNDAYNKIKERRKYVFQKPKTPTREALLKQTYGELVKTREARDLIQLEYQKVKKHSDSLWQNELIRKADNILRNKEMEGYLLIDPQQFSEGVVEFHSLLPANFLQIEPIKQSLQVAIVEERMKQEGIRVGKIQEWLKPIALKEIQLQGREKKEFDFMTNYLGPVVVVLFLFVSIFTSSGFLFNGLIKEKTNRVIEILLSSVHHIQLITGKIAGLGLLGVLQILIWFIITFLLIVSNVLNVGEIAFLTMKNAGLFLLYYLLGFLLFSSVFIGIGSLLSDAEDAKNLNQLMRLLSIFPIVLAVLVLESPNSLAVRILSYMPPLTPTFMILRTPLGNPPATDYYITVGIMGAAILVCLLIAVRMFRIGSLLNGKKPSFRQFVSLLVGKV